jgi:hypothetical protein
MKDSIERDAVQVAKCRRTRRSRFAALVVQLRESGYDVIYMSDVAPRATMRRS